MKLASIGDVKVYLEKQDSDQDNLIGMFIDAVSGSMEGYTSREFEKLSRTEYFNAGGDIFQLKAFPIDAAIAMVVMVDGTAMSEGSDYAVFHDKGYVEFASSTSMTDPKSVSITYTGGYAWTTGSGRIAVPNDLWFACVTQSSYNFKNRRTIGLNSFTLPDGSINVNNQDEFLPQVLSVLDRYKI